MQLLVSRIEAGFATLVTEDHHFLELPLYVRAPPPLHSPLSVDVDVKLLSCVAGPLICRFA